MRFFFFKLVTPRADFMRTMTEAERAIMLAHRAYWQGFADKGWAVAYGPVLAAEGAFGAGFWMLPEEVDPQSIADADPAILANAGFRYEISPMAALVRGKAAAE